MQGFFFQECLLRLPISRCDGCHGWGCACLAHDAVVHAHWACAAVALRLGSLHGFGTLHEHCIREEMAGGVVHPGEKAGKHAAMLKVFNEGSVDCPSFQVGK